MNPCAPVRYALPLDLREHGRAAGDLGIPDDAGAELGARDALVDELLAARKLAGALEEREPGGGTASARRAVDLAVGEDGDVPLPQGRAHVDPLPEDDAVHVAELRLDRVDERTARLQPAFTSRPSWISSEVPRPHGERRGDGRVVRPAEGDVRAEALDEEALRLDERGHVPKRTERNAPPSTRANVSSRPEGTSTTTRVSGSSTGSTPFSSAQVTSAIVPCPQAVE